jgi:hypothetical protein
VEIETLFAAQHDVGQVVPFDTQLKLGNATQELNLSLVLPFHCASTSTDSKVFVSSNFGFMHGAVHVSSKATMAIKQNSAAFQFNISSLSTADSVARAAAEAAAASQLGILPNVEIITAVLQSATGKVELHVQDSPLWRQQQNLAAAAAPDPFAPYWYAVESDEDVVNEAEAGAELYSSGYSSDDHYFSDESESDSE